MRRPRGVLSLAPVDHGAALVDHDPAERAVEHEGAGRAVAEHAARAEERRVRDRVPDVGEGPPDASLEHEGGRFEDDRHGVAPVVVGRRECPPWMLRRRDFPANGAGTADEHATTRGQRGFGPARDSAPGAGGGAAITVGPEEKPRCSAIRGPGRTQGVRCTTRPRTGGRHHCRRARAPMRATAGQLRRSSRSRPGEPHGDGPTETAPRRRPHGDGPTETAPRRRPHGDGPTETAPQRRPHKDGPTKTASAGPYGLVGEAARPGRPARDVPGARNGQTSVAWANSTQNLAVLPGADVVASVL